MLFYCSTRRGSVFLTLLMTKYVRSPELQIILVFRVFDSTLSQRRGDFHLFMRSFKVTKMHTMRVTCENIYKMYKVKYLWTLVDGTNFCLRSVS